MRERSGSAPQKLVLAFISVILFVSPAQATEWWRVALHGHKPTREVYLADIDSMHAEDGYNAIWTQHFNETLGRDRIKSKKMLWLTDCQQRRLKIKSIIAYAASGEVINSESGQGSWIDAPPASVGDSILRFSCGDQSHAISFSGYDADTIARATFYYEK